ncbi:hypothetical protein H6G00_00010 [Leptolyngbya sp. FACHB-541]|uniref:hypothetical protein n=1 Tax=Leptolyngbya sp. FACHB-541 TaxID=2692810 RepID=UPI001689F75A|nr:hypothetical protein [Leptolyngbya sp. FACHB-541]MBD1995017.1 hypothetical protein [Leptolyngbya sp. FACHB-541]
MNSPSPNDEQQLQQSIEQSLQEIALQMGQPIDSQVAQQVYQSAADLLSHLVYAPITLARLAGTLLVYQLQDVESQEVEWFKSQVKGCPNDDEVEELIESLHRIDSL